MKKMHGLKKHLDTFEINTSSTKQLQKSPNYLHSLRSVQNELLLHHPDFETWWWQYHAVGLKDLRKFCNVNNMG